MMLFGMFLHSMLLYNLWGQNNRKLYLLRKIFRVQNSTWSFVKHPYFRFVHSSVDHVGDWLLLFIMLFLGVHWAHICQSLNRTKYYVLSCGNALTYQYSQRLLNIRICVMNVMCKNIEEYTFSAKLKSADTL